MSFLRRYALWIFLATVACTAGAREIADHQPVAFTATATVDVEATVIPGTTPTTPDAGTEVTVATSGVVVSSMSQSFGMSPVVLAKHLSVANPAGTNILEIACAMPTASAAQACANDDAVAYRDYRNDSASPAKVRALDPLHVSIVTFAPLPGAQSHKRKVELLALGVIFGLGLGVGTALLRDHLDDRVRDQDDLERCLGAPVLADIRIPGGRVLPLEAAVIGDEQPSLTEAYRHLRARLSPLIESTDIRGKVILVTSSRAAEGSAAVASNLAAVMAVGGLKVLLVDADVRYRSLSKVFEVREQRGLSDLLGERVKPDDVIMQSDLVPGLRFMSPGTVTDRPADLLDKSRLGRVFQQLTVVADVVIVSCAPIRVASDALGLAPVSDIVILAATLNRTERASVAAAVQEIREVGPVTIVGVLNHPAPLWRRALTRLWQRATALPRRYAGPLAEDADAPEPKPDLGDGETVLNFGAIEPNGRNDGPITESLRNVQVNPGSELSGKGWTRAARRTRSGF
jgi:polysaccharide biosynthesis transport protein